MKLKFHAVITNPLRFATGDPEWAISLMSEPTTISGWHNLNEIEIDVPDEVVRAIHKEALAELDEQEKTTRDTFAEAMNAIERKRGELLALPSPTTGDDNDHHEEN